MTSPSKSTRLHRARADRLPEGPIPTISQSRATYRSLIRLETNSRGSSGAATVSSPASCLEARLRSIRLLFLPEVPLLLCKVFFRASHEDIHRAGDLNAFFEATITARMGDRDSGSTPCVTTGAGSRGAKVRSFCFHRKVCVPSPPSWISFQTEDK